MVTIYHRLSQPFSVTVDPTAQIETVAGVAFNYMNKNIPAFFPRKISDGNAPYTCTMSLLSFWSPDAQAQDDLDDTAVWGTDTEYVLQTMAQLSVQPATFRQLVAIGSNPQSAYLQQQFFIVGLGDPSYSDSEMVWRAPVLGGGKSVRRGVQRRSLFLLVYDYRWLFGVRFAVVHP